MKTINAATLPGHVATLELQARRLYGSLNTGAIKRSERRSQRHQLRRRLPSDIHFGIEEGVLDTRAALLVESLSGQEHPTRHLYSVPAGYLSESCRTQRVTVIRKQAHQRKPMVEILQMPMAA
jgi:hypothetical protein